MFRTPIPNADIAWLENFSTDQLIGLFSSSLRSGPGRITNVQLADAWGALFTGLYLSAEELVDELQRNEHRIADTDERMLREFIAADCRNGSPFVLNVIKKGGKTDRAALIMIADLENLAAIEINGTTALHLLAEACDKGIRPAFIRRAGKELLSRIYDSRGIPVIFSIYALGDLGMPDLDAIAKVFSENELKGVMCKNRMGKNAFTVFSDIAQSLRSRPSMERHTFFKSGAVRNAEKERDS